MTRRETFSSSHKMWNSDWDEEKNRRVFGKCAGLHGHNYILKVTVRGPVDVGTGMVIDIAILKDAIKQHVLNDFDHKNLNEDVKEFIGTSGFPCTAENIAIVIFERLRNVLPEKILYKVELFETENNSVVYFGEEEP